jgi:hypothetical protein
MSQHKKLVNTIERGFQTASDLSFENGQTACNQTAATVLKHSVGDE